MITYITGTLGAGKTFQGVRMAMDHLAAGRTLVTNVDVDFEVMRDRIARRHLVWIRSEQCIKFDPELTPSWESVIPWGAAEGDVLVLLDECHLFYNARDWASSSKALLSFLSQSRKAGVDVVWITQDAGNVDKQFRVLAEWELAIVNTRHLALGWLGELPFNAYLVKHITAREGYVVKRRWYTYDRYVRGAYATSALLNAAMRSLADGAVRAGVESLARVTFGQRVRFYWGDFRRFLRCS